jgi:predicted nucleic acid-binding protein
MQNLLIDTNIVLDLLAKREPYYADAARLFSLADKENIKLSVNALTFANTNYILSKLLSVLEARDVLGKFRVLVSVLPLNDKIIDLALNDSNFPDFEDGLQYYTALENNQNFIISRDLKGFRKSVIPVMTAEQFCATI